MATVEVVSAENGLNVEEKVEETNKELAQEKSTTLALIPADQPKLAAAEEEEDHQDDAPTKVMDQEQDKTSQVVLLSEDEEDEEDLEDATEILEELNLEEDNKISTDSCARDNYKIAPEPEEVMNANEDDTDDGEEKKQVFEEVAQESAVEETELAPVTSAVPNA